MAAENKFWVKALIVAGFMGSALALSSALSDRSSIPTEDMAKATAPVQSKLDAAMRELEVTKRQLEVTKHQLANALQFPPYARKMGPIHMLNAFSATGAIWRELVPLNGAILFTATPENNELLQDLGTIFGIGMREVDKQLTPGKSPLLSRPNYQRDIDAPRLVDTELSGIVIHGEGSEQLRNFFERCFVTRYSSKIPDGLADFYKFHRVIWIEIGTGSPWKAPMQCAE